MTNELAYFTNSVNTLIEGKLILVDKHIATVLRCVATSPTLCKALNDAVKTMSYATEFSRARVTWTRSDGVVEASLKLPADRNRLFAFVVCLLTEVDSGRRNIMEFLKEYYNDADSNVSYYKFVNEVLKPFKKAGENILRTVDPESLNHEYVQQAEQFFVAEKIYVDSALANAVFAKMEEIRLSLSSLNEADAKEFAAVSEFLVNAMYLKNPKVLKVCYLAYKNTVGKYIVTRQAGEELAKLMSQLPI